MQARLKSLPLLLALATTGAGASTLVVSSTGTFSASTPTSSTSAPNGSYALSFDISSTPSVSGVSAGNSFDVAYSNFSYTVNGVASTAPVGSITFYNGAISGLLSVCFTAACPGNGIPADGLVFEGAQAYSGSESDPTILPNVYSPSLEGIVVNGNPILLSSDGPLTITATGTPASVTPEPACSTCRTRVAGEVGNSRGEPRYGATGAAPASSARSATWSRSGWCYSRFCFSTPVNRSVLASTNEGRICAMSRRG